LIIFLGLQSGRSDTFALYESRVVVLVTRDASTRNESLKTYISDAFCSLAMVRHLVSDSFCLSTSLIPILVTRFNSKSMTKVSPLCCFGIVTNCITGAWIRGCAATTV
jgi:hypothetical protein